MTQLLLPGTPITYYGDEMGVQDTYVRWSQTVDPAGRNVGISRYTKFSRDPARSPFPWDDSVNAGIIFYYIFAYYYWLIIESASTRSILKYNRTFPSQVSPTERMERGFLSTRTIGTKTWLSCPSLRVTLRRTDNCRAWDRTPQSLKETCTYTCCLNGCSVFRGKLDWYGTRGHYY